MLSLCGADKRGPVVLNKRVMEFFFADCYGGLPREKCLVPSSIKAVLLSPCPTQITHAEVSGARQDGEGGIPSPKPANGCSSPTCPSPEQPGRSCSAGRTWAAAGAAGLGPAECQRVMNTLSPVTSLHRRGEGNRASKGGRQEGPEFPGAAAPQCLSSSERRVKVFALGIIIKDIWVLLSHALFFFVFLINCKPHPDC